MRIVNATQLNPVTLMRHRPINWINMLYLKEYQCVSRGLIYTQKTGQI